MSTSYKPGKSGNPNGRPKKDCSLTELMREHLYNIPEGEKKTNRQSFIEKTYTMAMKGDIAALKLIWQYIDGMPKQSIDHTSAGEPIAFTWKENDNRNTIPTKTDIPKDTSQQ